MNKYKINNTIAAILLIASFFVSWQSLLLVIVLLFAFCEIDERINNLTINIVSFTIGIKLIELAWDVIYKTYELIPTVINKLVNVVNHYLSEPIYLGKFQAYVLDPIGELFSIGNDVVSLLIVVATFFFITSLLFAKNKKIPIIGNFLAKYIGSVLNFIAQFNANVNMTQNNNINVQPDMNTQPNINTQPNMEMPNINNQVQQNINNQNNMMN